MAAKRSLYKPAQLESVGSKEHRGLEASSAVGFYPGAEQEQKFKDGVVEEGCQSVELARGWSPLVQGRLVTKPVIPDTMTVYASPADLRSSHSNTGTAGDTSITVSHSGLPSDGYSTPPRLSLANVSMNTTSQHHSPGPTTVPPRSYGPGSVSQQVPGSPPKPTPSAVLELSDAEDRHATSQTRSPITHIQHRPSSPVLMVDAGGRRKDPDASEVEIMTNLVTSPAKVVCHAPAVVESDLRNTGYIQEAAKVTVDSVPSVSLYGDLDVTAEHPTKIEAPLHRTKPPQVVKEGTHTSITGAVKIKTKREKPRAPSLSDESSARETSASSADNSRSTSLQQKKKKTKGKVVTSRYMQSTTSTKQRADTMQQSILDASRRPPSRNESMRRPLSTRPSTKPITRKTSKSSSRVGTKPHLSYTPMVGGKGAVSGGVTSTPAVNLSQLPSRSGLDASAIQPVHGMSTLMSEDMSMIAQLSQSASSPSQRPDVDVTDTTVHAPQQKKQNKDPEVTQDYLDRLYARYLQWVYIDTKLRKTFQEQEKEATGQLFAMWCENEKMRKHKAELELELAKIKHENHVDEQLEIQRSGLGPITANSDQYKQQYSTMAHALDTTRHQLPLKGIHVPDDEEQYQDALIAALDESEKLLHQLSLTVGSSQGSKVTSFAKALQTLENVVENEDKELKRCQELLAATTSLTTHASSLQIQQLEAH